MVTPLGLWVFALWILIPYSAYRVTMLCPALLCSCHSIPLTTGVLLLGRGALLGLGTPSFDFSPFTFEPLPSCLG
jgi:hypothetical protein